jgi:hypothetical protein
MVIQELLVDLQTELKEACPTSRGPKKGTRAMSPGGVDSILSCPPAGSRYSRCRYNGRGGHHAMNITLPHASVTDDAAAPHASAQAAFSNCISPGVSTTQWQNRCPQMKPPHLDVEQRVVDDRLDAGDGGALEDEALEAREPGARGRRRRRAGRLLVRRSRVLLRGVPASSCFLVLALPDDLVAAAASAFVAAPPPCRI